MARIIQDNKGAPVLALQCFRDQERIDGFDVAVIAVTADLIATCEARVAAMAAITDPRLSVMEYWDYTPEYYTGDWENDGGTQDYPDPLWARGDGFSHRTECDRMVVSRGGISWSCYAKHTDTPITTEKIDVADLRAVLAQGEAVPRG